MEFEQVAVSVEGIPFMSPILGRRVYDHVRRSRPGKVLELGTAHGVSCAYIAAALQANGAGHVTTVDHAGAAYDPPPSTVLARAGVADRVTIVCEHSSYNWFLKEQVQAASDAAGNCEPQYDFCYLDGSKNVNSDGLVVVLIEMRLRPGGLRLMDDLELIYGHNSWIAPHADGRALGAMSQSVRTELLLAA